MRPSCSGASLTNFHDANPNIRQSLQVNPRELSCPLWLADPWHFDPSTSLCECVLGTLTLLIVQPSVHLPPCVQVAGLHWALSGRLLSCRASAVNPIDMVLVGKTNRLGALNSRKSAPMWGWGQGGRPRVLRGRRRGVSHMLPGGGDPVRMSVTLDKFLARTPVRSQMAQW